MKKLALLISAIFTVTCFSTSSAQTLRPDSIDFTTKFTYPSTVMMSPSGYRPSRFFLGWNYGDPSDTMNAAYHGMGRLGNLSQFDQNFFHFDTNLREQCF